MLTGTVALITGGSRGIGAACARKLAALGADIAVVYAGNAEKANEVCAACEALGVRARAYQCNVADFDAVKQTVAAVKAELGSVDLLVNSAGITRDGLVAAMCEADFDAVIGTNLKGTFNMIRHCARLFLRAGHGRIVNISSVGGVFHNSGFAYAAAKSAVIGMTRNMAMQFAAEGIRVNAVCPGGTKTPMIEAMNDPDQMLPCDKEFARITGRHFNTKLPMCTAEEQANAILFLASDEASGITGQYLVVDHGGWI